MDKGVFVDLIEDFGAISILKAVSETLEEGIENGDDITVNDIIMILDGTIEMIKLDSEFRSLMYEVKFPSNGEELTEFINSISVKEEN